MGKSNVEKDKPLVDLDEVMIDETICRLCLQGKSREYIVKVLQRKGVPYMYADEAVRSWYEERDSLDFTSVKKSLCKWLQASVADCLDVGDKRGAYLEARLLTRLLSIDPSKDSAKQQIAKEREATDKIDINFKLRLKE